MTYLNLIRRKFLIVLFALTFSTGYAQECEEFTMGRYVELVAQGFDWDANRVRHKDITDPENQIPEIPQAILNEVSSYLNGNSDFDVNSVITEKNYRDYLNAAKYFDLLSNEGYQNSTYPIRRECLLKSNGTIKTLEAFSYRLNSLFFEDFDKDNQFLPNKKYELYHAGQYELIFVPEWIETQKRIIREVVDTVQSFSIQLDYENPHFILFTGTYGSGKSYQVRHHRLTEHLDFDPNAFFSGVLGTDAIKQLYKVFFPGATGGQVHHEGVAIRLQIMKALFCHFPNLSILQEAVLSTESSIEEQFALAHENGFKINLVDLDADLETACLRILKRDPSKGEANPHFRAIVAAEKMIRTNRSILQKKVQKSDDVALYELIVSNKGETHLVAQKQGKVIMVLPGQEERFLEALEPSSLIIQEKVAQRVITKDDCLLYGNQLEKFVGMTIEDALLKLSKL